MENHCAPHSSNICCFCDKNLSPGDTQGGDIKSPITKYKCPGCERTYCSADCCSGHKEKFDCPGVRNQTPYVPLNKFDQKQFLDDYFFLERINADIERARRILPQIRVKHNSSLKQTSNKRKKRNRHQRQKPATEPSNEGLTNASSSQKQ